MDFDYHSKEEHWRFSREALHIHGKQRPIVIPAEAGIHRTQVKQPCVYIMASKRNGTLYIGTTSNLSQRVW